MSSHSRHYRKGVILAVYRRKDEKLEYLSLYSPRHGKGWKLLKGTQRNMPLISVADKELFDEAGLKAKRIQAIDDRAKYEFRDWEKRGYNVIGQDLQAFVVETNPDAQVQIDYRENVDFHWGGLDETKKLLRYEDHRRVLEKADRFIRKQIELEKNLQKS